MPIVIISPKTLNYATRTKPYINRILLRNVMDIESYTMNRYQISVTNLQFQYSVHLLHQYIENSTHNMVKLNSTIIMTTSRNYSKQWATSLFDLDFR